MAKKLLLADDSITIQKVVELVLSEEDFQIKAVNNGNDALKQFEVFRPDIVLADIEMPQVNGYQLCEKIKKSPLSSGIPVVLLAGAFEPLDEELAKNVGADGYIIKPFESQELISKVNAALTAASIGGGQVEIEVGEGNAEEAAIVSEENGRDEFDEAVSIADSSQGEDLWAMEDVASVQPGSAEEAWQIDDNSSIEEIAAETVMMKTPVNLNRESVGMPNAPRAEKEPASVGRPASSVQPGAGISEDAVSAAVKAAVQQQIAEIMAKIDFSKLVEGIVSRHLKESIEGILKENAAGLIKKAGQEMLNGSVSSLKKDIENVIWETIPDLAENIIKKEIDRIKADY